MTTLAAHLEKMGKRIERFFPNVNYGGCCVYAVIVAKELQLRGARPRIVVSRMEGFGNGKENIEEARHLVRRPEVEMDWNDHGIHFNHVGVEFRYFGAWWQHDTLETKPFDGKLMDWNVYDGRLTIREAELLASVPGNWNSQFLRNRIPALRAMVKASFKFYDRNHLGNSTQKPVWY